MSAVVAIKPGIATAQSPRTGIEASLDQLDEHLDNLKRCLHWLFAERIAVLSVDMRRGRVRPMINVAAHPRLYITCQDDCVDGGQRFDGAITHRLWTAHRHGCEIWWEEAECA